MKRRLNNDPVGRTKRTQELSRMRDFAASRKEEISGNNKRQRHYRGTRKSHNMHRDLTRHKHKHHHKRYGKYQYYYNGWWYSEPWWMDGYYDDQLTCLEAQQIIRQNYRSVRMVECVGRFYAFKAKDARGKIVELRVDSQTGTYWPS